MGMEKYAYGKETYWTTSGDYFLYWCARFDKWYIAGEEDLQNNQRGGCTGYARAPMASHDITDALLTNDWAEKGATQWISRQFAGVANVGKFGVSDVGSSKSHETGTKSRTPSNEAGVDANSNDDDQHPLHEAGATELPQQTTKCPAKQVVRTVQRKAGEMGEIAVGWAL